jgi:hypothetical protein
MSVFWLAKAAMTLAEAKAAFIRAGFTVQSHHVFNRDGTHSMELSAGTTHVVGESFAGSEPEDAADLLSMEIME